MANEYIALPVVANNLGLFAVNKSVIESIAMVALTDFEDAKIAEKTTLKSPVVCKIDENKLNLSINVRIRYNAKIADTCLVIQNRINQSLMQIASLSCHQIDVKVVGFIF